MKAKKKKAKSRGLKVTKPMSSKAESAKKYLKKKKFQFAYGSE